MAEQDGATPPDGGRMNHDVMRKLAKLPLNGPGATDTVAATGGIERAGHVGEGNTPDQQADRADADRVPPPTRVSADKMNRDDHGREE